MRIKFRPMLLEDLPQVLLIENSRNDLHWPEYIFRNHITAGHKCFVVEKNNKLIAYTILTFIKEEAHVANICVTTKEQNKGYGRYIMQHLLTIACNKKASKVTLHVRENKKNVCDFYRHLGFKEVNRLPNYYQFQQDKEAALVFEFNLDIEFTQHI